MPPRTVLGIDLAHKTWADCGAAWLTFAPGEPAVWVGGGTGSIAWPTGPVSPEAMARAIDDDALLRGASAVSIDGPQGWRDPAADRVGVGRWCEYEAKTPGKTGSYGTVYPATYEGWVGFSIAVFEALLARPHVVLANDPAATRLPPLPAGGYYLLECFPTSTWRTSGLVPLPGHKKAPPPVVAHHAQNLRRAFDLTASILTSNHDDLQAVVAALPAAGLLDGPCMVRPRGEAARDVQARGDVPAHRVEGLIWDASPIATLGVAVHETRTERPATPVPTLVEHTPGSDRPRYDAIVLGVGGMGSAACYHLARRGKRVLGLERFDIPHALGSSHGVNRIIRLAYYEDPRYVPLLRRAYELWRELEIGFGEQLLHITGSVDASAPDGEVFQGSLRSCEEHGLPHEVLTSPGLSKRFPGFRLPAEHLALFQPDGGFLLSERCIVAHVVAAQAAGAAVRARERVLGWEPVGDGVRVETDRGRYDAERLVICAGAWIGELVPEMKRLARPERQVLGWFQPNRPALFAPARCPVFNLTVPEGRYYGFPVFGVPGFKVGRYHHRGEEGDPESLAREPDAADEALLRDFTARYFPDAAGPTMALKTCLFTNTPDEHFVVDTLPDHPQVVVASPCSGHGFKFCAVIGEILADLLERNETAHDIGLFRLRRFAEERASVLDGSP